MNTEQVKDYSELAIKYSEIVAKCVAQNKALADQQQVIDELTTALEEIESASEWQHSKGSKIAEAALAKVKAGDDGE